MNSKSTKKHRPAVLVVCGDDSESKNITRVVKDFGAKNITTSSSGTDSVKKAVKLKPEIIIVHEKLKGKIDFLSAIAEIRKKCSSQFICIFESFTPGLISKVKNKYLAEVIVKPYTKSDLKTALSILTTSIDTQNKLREYQKKYITLLERIQDGVFIACNGKLIFVNENLAASLGYTVKQLYRKSLSDILPSDEYKFIIKRYKARLANKNVPDSYEIRLLNKNKELVTANLSIGLINDDEDKIVIGTLKDITQSKKTSQALLESERRFKTFYDNTLIGIYRTTTDRKIVLANPALIAMLGYDTLDELIRNQNASKTFEPANNHSWFGVEIHKHGQILGYETQWRRADGNLIWVRENAKAVYDDSGKMIFIDGTVENITEKKLSDEALVTSEKRFHSLFTNMTEGSALHHLIIDSDDQPVNYLMIDINPAYEKIIGLKRDQVIGKLATEVYNSMVPPFLKQFSSTVLTGVALLFETYYEPLKKYFEISVAPWGEYGFATIFSDTTNRKFAEQQLKLSEERYRSFVRQSSEGIWCFALNKPVSVNEPLEKQAESILNNGSLIECNEVFAEMTGYNSVSEMIGIPIRKILNLADSQKFNLMKKFISFGYKISDYETIESDRFGKSKHILNNLAGIIADNKLTHVWATRRDVTERKDFEQELRKLSRAVEQSPSSIIITNTEGNIEYVNPKFSEVTGYTYEEVIGKNPRFLKSEYKTDADYSEMWRALTSGHQWQGEFLNKKKSGELFWEQASISPILNDDGVATSYIAIKEDVTLRKRFEEELIRAKESAEKADKLKTEFLAQMSHEIRTPLNNILTYIGLVREEFEQKLPVGMESSFVIIDNSSKRLIRTIELILNLSEIQTGNFKVRKEIINLDKDILENISLEFFSRAKAKNIDLVYEKKTSNGKILGDTYSIAQIFNNLLENALKYTNHGRVDVLLYEQENKVCVEVKDTGIGISAQYLPNLFSPFTQEEMGYTRRFEGNGLGLSLVKKYVEINGADITVESEKHKGSNFKVIFNQYH